jgi:hypothetical protein
LPSPTMSQGSVVAMGGDAVREEQTGRSAQASLVP